MTCLAAALLAVGCMSSPTDPANQQEPTSVEIAPAELQTSGGTPAQFDAVVRDASGQALAGTYLEWTTTDPSVAIVDTQGKVWSFSEGTATATASFPGRGKSSPGGNAYGHSKQDAEIEVTAVEPDRPGRVSDLAVVDRTSSSVSLEFTEVDDGTGSPAEYLVRFQIAPLDWATAADVVQGTCAKPLRGDGIGTFLRCSVGGLAAATTYGFQLIALRSTDGDYGDLSNVVTASTDALEPTLAGGSTIVDETWTSHEPESWYSAGNRSVVSTLGSNSVLQMRYQEGFTGGVGPANLSYNWSSTLGITPDDITVTMRWTANEGWQSHQSNVNKIAFIWLDTSGQFIPVLYKDHIRIAPEKAGGWGWLTPNVNWEASKPKLGAWNELVFKFTKTAPSTWSVRWWVNGTLVGDYSGVPMPESSGFRTLSLNPTWGGTGDVKTQTDHFWWDRVTVTKDS